MTRKDYVLIAEALKEARRVSQYPDGISTAARCIAGALAAANPRFDRARFLRACGVLS